jgi:hypothetical protein
MCMLFSWKGCWKYKSGHSLQKESEPLFKCGKCVTAQQISNILARLSKEKWKKMIWWGNKDLTTEYVAHKSSDSHQCGAVFKYATYYKELQYLILGSCNCNPSYTNILQIKIPFQWYNIYSNSTCIQERSQWKIPCSLLQPFSCDMHYVKHIFIPYC